MVKGGVNIDVKNARLNIYACFIVHQMRFQERLPYRQFGTYLESQIFTRSAQMVNVSNLNETVDPFAVPTSVWWPKS